MFLSDQCRADEWVWKSSQQYCLLSPKHRVCIRQGSPNTENPYGLQGHNCQFSKLPLLELE